MDMGPRSGLAIPKPEKRATTKRRQKREHADHVADVRAYVFGRERGICRCCRSRRAQSMHELHSRGAGGKVSKRNSIALCGDGVRGCHGMLQRHEILWAVEDYALRAEAELAFQPQTQAAADWLKIGLGETIASAPLRDESAD